MILELEFGMYFCCIGNDALVTNMEVAKQHQTKNMKLTLIILLLPYSWSSLLNLMLVLFLPHKDNILMAKIPMAWHNDAALMIAFLEYFMYERILVTFRNT